MRYQDDQELVAIDVEGDRVVAVSIKNSWRDQMTTADLGSALSEQLARSWAEPAIDRFREVTAQLDRMASLEIPRPDPSDFAPNPALADRRPSLQHLAMISEELEQINDRVRAKLADPNYFADLTPTRGREFVSRDGNVTLGYFGDRVVGISLDDEYFRRANIMSVNESVQRAFEEFYSEEHPEDVTADHDPELTADRAKISRIQDELETI